MQQTESFGYWLRRRRKALDLTQAELAARVSCTAATIRKIEADERKPSNELANLLANQLSVPADQRQDFLRSARHTASASHTVGSVSVAPYMESIASPTRFQSLLNNLPAQLTRFIGREWELAEVWKLMTSTRLLTLTGSGGCGKTRLAIALGDNMLSQHHGQANPVGDAKSLSIKLPDGIWLVELAPVAEPGLVADTILHVLGLQAVIRPATEVLADYLRDQRLLLILDNCEHLVQACAKLIEALLRSCPGLRVLATSREPLNIPGEVTWRVPSLTLEEGTQLFTERAYAARPDLDLTSAKSQSIARICQRLDNMPLALELAAARVRAFSVEQIASRLDNVFLLLTGGARTALPRQQTLCANIDWSYNLLTDPERALLGKLSVFVGGWTLEAAEAIYGTGVLGPLEQLVYKSLVVVEEYPAGMRYRMLDTIRQYAYATLRVTRAGADVERNARQRHLEYYCSLSKVSRSTYLLGGTEGKRLAKLLAAEIDNARAALAWAAQSGSWQAIIDGGMVLVFYLLNQGYGNEVRKCVETAVLSNLLASDTARVRALFNMGRVSAAQRDLVGSSAQPLSFAPWF